MEHTPLRYLLNEGGVVTGPHSLAVLRQKAEIHVITRDTLIAFENDREDWAPIHALEVLSAELFPGQTTFTFGAKSFETVNVRNSEAPPTVQEMLDGNLALQQAAEGELLKSHPPRSNKRRNDYLILMLGLNAIIAIRLLQGAPVFDPFLVALFVMGNISLVWIMFVVMDRY